MPTQLEKTFETATEEELRDIYGDEDGDPLEDRIETHSGAWIRDGAVWVWWRVPEDD